jgi:DNA-directed RNA polymerase specialized sigma24 family protein
MKTGEATARIARDGAKLFSFALYLSGGDRDRAYDVAASASAEALVESDSSDKNSFLATACRAILRETAKTAVSHAFDQPAVAAPSPAETRLLSVVHTALASLPTESKALLLLRDQLTMSYEAIATATGIPFSEVKNRALEARRQLRKKVEDEIARAR